MESCCVGNWDKIFAIIGTSISQLSGQCLKKYSTVKLNYKKLGYNKLPVITNHIFSMFLVPNSLLTMLSNPVITNPGYNKQIWLGPNHVRYNKN